MTNFAERLAAAAAEDEDRPAVKLDDLVLSYRELDRAAAQAAGMRRATSSDAPILDVGQERMQWL